MCCRNPRRDRAPRVDSRAYLPRRTQHRDQYGQRARHGCIPLLCDRAGVFRTHTILAASFRDADVVGIPEAVESVLLNLPKAEHFIALRAVEQQHSVMKRQCFIRRVFVLWTVQRVTSSKNGCEVCRSSCPNLLLNQGCLQRNADPTVFLLDVHSREPIVPTIVSSVLHPFLHRTPCDPFSVMKV